MGTKKPRTRDKQGKIRRIIEVTAKLIAKNGYLATSTNSIATEAGVSIGLVYRYFPAGKQSILKRMVQDQIDSAVTGIDYSDITVENFPQLLKNIIAIQLAEHKKSMPLSKALEIAALNDSSEFAVFDDLIKIQLDPFVEIVKKAGYFKNVNDNGEIEKWILMLFNIMDSIIHRHVFYKKILESDEELVDYLCKIIIGFLESDVLVS